MSTPSLSVRLPAEMLEQLERLAESTGRTKSFLAAEALRGYLEREAWQIEEIEKWIQEAEAGDFASDDEARAVAEKWSGR
jgi:predicted transcriptional regulator